MKQLALFGNGGQAREIQAQMGQTLPLFVHDKYLDKYTKPISQFDPTKYKLLIAIADPIIRQKIVKELPSTVEYFTFIHRTALILNKDSITIGPGSFIGAYSILTTHISIGNHAILNRTNQIGHDTLIQDYFTALPGAIVSGYCSLGNNIIIGANSVIREKITICDNTIIGASSYVNNNIFHYEDEPIRYGGVPARELIL